ncbi:MAG: hypothetical protein WCS65_01420 [Verrucomicrobiae bacterium]
MTTLQIDLFHAVNSGLSQSHRTFCSRRRAFAVPAPRAEQLADILATGTDDAAECAASDAFKEFSGKEGK